MLLHRCICYKRQRGNIKWTVAKICLFMIIVWIVTRQISLLASQLKMNDTSSHGHSHIPAFTTNGPTEASQLTYHVRSSMTTVTKSPPTSHIEMVLNAEKQSGIITAHPYHFIVVEKTTCINTSALVLAAVLSEPHHFKERQLVRETWGASKYFPQVRMVVLFFLGQTDNTTLQESIYNEGLIFADIVQENFVDSYRNLTLKSVMILKWTSLYCSQIPFILKVDEDVFVHIFRLSAHVRSHIKEFGFQPTLLCLIFNATASRSPVIRDPSNKWAVTKEEYPLYTRKYHPTWCSGPAYMMSGNLAFSFYNASLYTPFLFLEDVFTTGLVRETLGQCNMTDMPNAHYYYYNKHFEKSTKQHRGRPEFAKFQTNRKLIFVHAFDVIPIEDRSFIWKYAMQDVKHE